MIGVVDYGIGNVAAFLRAFGQMGVPSMRVTSPEDFDQVGKLILPGVGAFDWAMNKLDSSGLRPKLNEYVQDRAMPVLGVCVGMQMLFHQSSEGSVPGLGWLEGSVTRIATDQEELRLPHMGWNTVRVTGESTLLKGLDGHEFYFLHSYSVQTPNIDQIKGLTIYGREIVSVIENGSIYGTQFHPEKSHQSGRKILENFILDTSHA